MSKESLAKTIAELIDTLERVQSSIDDEELDDAMSEIEESDFSKKFSRFKAALKKEAGW
jgi:DNA-binding MurR/RpiR family transcriptional regulator